MTKRKSESERYLQSKARILAQSRQIKYWQALEIVRAVWRSMGSGFDIELLKMSINREATSALMGYCYYDTMMTTLFSPPRNSLKGLSELIDINSMRPFEKMI